MTLKNLCWSIKKKQIFPTWTLQKRQVINIYPRYKFVPLGTILLLYYYVLVPPFFFTPKFLFRSQTDSGEKVYVSIFRNNQGHKNYLKFRKKNTPTTGALRLEWCWHPSQLLVKTQLQCSFVFLRANKPCDSQGRNNKWVYLSGSLKDWYFRALVTEHRGVHLEYLCFPPFSSKGFSSRT